MFSSTSSQFLNCLCLPYPRLGFQISYNSARNTLILLFFFYLDNSVAMHSSDFSLNHNIYEKLIQTPQTVRHPYYVTQQDYLHSSIRPCIRPCILTAPLRFYTMHPMKAGVVTALFTGVFSES